MKYAATVVVLVVALFTASAVQSPEASARVSKHRCHLIKKRHVAPRNLVQLGRCIQKWGYVVSEHPKFGGVHGYHAAGSCHYKGRAIDANWMGGGSEVSHEDKLYKIVHRIKHHYGHIRELFAPCHDPYGGHSGSNSHVHISYNCG